MATASEVDARLQELQGRVGDLVVQLESLASVKKGLADTTDGLAGASQSVSKLADDLGGVLAALATVAQSFQGAVAAFERIEPTKVVDELERLGARLDELGERMDAIRTAQVETLPKVVEGLERLGAHLGELGERVLDATRTAQAEVLRNVKWFGTGTVVAIVLSAIALWLLLTP